MPRPSDVLEFSCHDETVEAPCGDIPWDSAGDITRDAIAAKVR